MENQSNIALATPPRKGLAIASLVLGIMLEVLAPAITHSVQTRPTLCIKPKVP
ncbi:MAG TPA: hypothetical protein VLM38_05810 [Blastocatellia bacterium]|nr:hypothetical protein [Blastocatellia bacterium]